MHFPAVNIKAKYIISNSAPFRPICGSTYGLPRHQLGIGIYHDPVISGGTASSRTSAASASTPPA
jgi:hypothetical protein